MNILNVSKNFDYVYLDAMSNYLSVHDVNKLVENSYINKVVIKNWNKNYIANNYKALQKLKKHATIHFSILNVSTVDISAMQAFLAKEDSYKNISTFELERMIFVPQWIEKISNSIVWDNNLFYNQSFSFTVSKYVNQFPKNMKKIIIFPNNLLSMEESDLKALMTLSGLEYNFVSSYAGSLILKYGIDVIWPLTVSSHHEIDAIAASLRNYLNPLNITSVMVIFNNNLNKSILSLEEYYSISNLEKHVNVYIYGLPIDAHGKVSNDVERFKWISDVKYNNYFKSGIDIYNKNNINFVLLR